MGCATSTECLPDRRPSAGRYKQRPVAVESTETCRERRDTQPADDPDEPSEAQTRYTAAAARRRYAAACDRADIALVDKLERTRSVASSQCTLARACSCINSTGSNSAYDDGAACDSAEPALRCHVDEDEEPSADGALASLLRAHSHSHAQTSAAGSHDVPPAIAANVFDILESDSDDDADFTVYAPVVSNAATPHDSSPALLAAAFDAPLPGAVPREGDDEYDARGAAAAALPAFAPSITLCHADGEFATPKTYHNGASARSPLETLRDKIYSAEAPPPKPSRRPQPRPLLTRTKPVVRGAKTRR